MHAELRHLVNLFKGVQAVREAMKLYCLHPDMDSPDIWDVINAFQQSYGVKIRRFKIPGSNGPLVRGMYLPFNKENNREIVILLDGEQNEKQDHYVSIKEMCHLILKDDEYMTQSPTNLIEMMIYEETTPLDGEAPLDLVADMWAKYAAHEIIFPFTVRQEARDSIGSGSSIMQIASRYGIPEHIVEWTLRPSYHETCKQAWEEISD